MADAHTGSSVVVVDPAAQAEYRDRLAREVMDHEATLNLTLQIIHGLQFTVPFNLKVVAPDAEKPKIQALLDDAFKLCDKHLNCYNPQSEVSEVNAAAPGKVVPVSPILARFLQAALPIIDRSNGAFDIAVGDIHQHLVTFLATFGTMPTAPHDVAEAQRIAERSRWVNSFCFTPADAKKKTPATIKRLHANARMMLGAMNKGFTVDLVIESLVANAFNHCIFDWGGDVRAVGLNHRREVWKVAVREPPSLADIRQQMAAATSTGTPVKPLERKYLCVLPLENAALCTSGDYENLLALDPHQQGGAPSLTAPSMYVHTVDLQKATLLQATETTVAQVTVQASTCAVADGLATAAFVKSELPRVRGFLEPWRYTSHHVKNFITYTRTGRRVAKMNEVARETVEMRQERISRALPARVIVIGGGLAGVCAAIEAADCGATVVLLEKTDKIGGNSAKATSGINGWGTDPQGDANVQDAGKFFERDTYLSGVGGRCDTGLVQLLSLKSADAIHWLMKVSGLKLTTLFQLGGHSRRRTHRVPDSADGKPVPVGFSIMSALTKLITTQYQKRITVLTHVEAVRLLETSFMEPGDIRRVRVNGVAFRDSRPTAGGASAPLTNLTADAVILATGGFCNDHTSTSLLHEFVPQLESIATTNGPFATGDGVKMARAIGASLVDMDKVQLHPTGFINPKDPKNPTKFLGPEALRGSGGVLVNSLGKRFVNELDLRSKVSEAINKQGNIYPDSNNCKFAFCILNAEAIAKFGAGQLAFYKDKIGLFRDAPDVTALAQIIGCPVDVLRATLVDYEAACRAGRCPATGKIVFPSVVGPQGHFVVALVTPVLHYSMGGVAISAAAEVQIEMPSPIAFGRKRPILGLFAAGEVSAGVHGANRLGGNSLLECVVFGRIAGDRAATILQANEAALSAHDWHSVVVREVREGGEFGHGSRIVRFNLPGSLQKSGLKMGQFVAIRGEWDGQQLIGYYSPITLPNDYGVIGLLVRTDKGTLKEWISALSPGHSVYMKACGGLAIDRRMHDKCFAVEGRQVRSIGLIAGGTGVAPMLQILRGALKQPYLEGIRDVRLIYAAENEEEMTYVHVLRQFVAHSNEKFKLHLVVNTPPPGWTEGVGFIDQGMLQEHMITPAEDAMVVICGPPVMQRVVKQSLLRIGFKANYVRTVDEEPKPAGAPELGAKL